MRIPGPSDLLHVAGAGYDALEQAIGMIPRVAGLLDRVDGLLDRVDQLVGGVEKTVTRAESLVGGVEQTAARADALVSELEPTMAKLQPILQTLGDTTSPDEVSAMVHLIDLLPALPEAWPTGRLCGVRVRGSCTIDIAWKDGALDLVTLHPEIAGKRVVRIGHRRTEVVLRPGRATTLAASDFS